MSSKYTNETGPGYLGIIKLTHYSLEIPFGVWPDYDWRTDDDLWVVKNDNGLGIVDEEPENPISNARVKVVNVGPGVCVPARAVREQLDVSPGSDVRIYRRDCGGMLVVPADPDPMLATDGGTPHHEKMRWCEGCQDNVETTIGNRGPECPTCGTDLGGMIRD